MLEPDTDCPDELIERIRTSIIGDDYALEGPFGHRRLTYADYTASGRCLSFIEDFLRDQVLPFYANTHSEISATGAQTSRYREEARAIIKAAVGADERDVVIFCGSGATGAIQKLIDVLGLRHQGGHGLSTPEENRPVVFIGPYEHHSNELPWRESSADVVVIDIDADGQIDQEHLREALEHYAERPRKFGSFSAASNVTGIGSKTREITALLHRHGALAFWDFAAAAPYVRMEMNMLDEGPDGELLHKDAIFISPHKFVGGPGTPGILVAKRRLFTNEVPTIPGGGTVSYVSSGGHRYRDDVEVREEGGTPAIIESIRAGLVFKLKEEVGHETIEVRERSFVTRAIAEWSKHPNIRILGNPQAWRLSIVSFVIEHRARALHHHFVVALLNDLFGIQARGGCSCAGPYGHRLLGIDLERSAAFECEILQGAEGLKPGWVRLSFNYFISETTFRFLVNAVLWVAEHGWKMVPEYRFCPETGAWRHRVRRSEPMGSLGSLSFRHGSTRPSQRREPESRLQNYLDEASAIVERCQRDRKEPDDELMLEPSFERLRWFWLPNEARALASQTSGEL